MENFHAVGRDGLKNRDARRERRENRRDEKACADKRSGLAQIHVFFDIRAIGNLNAHGDAQSVDNGSEFADADGIARSAINAEEKRTAVYYCHA